MDSRFQFSSWPPTLSEAQIESLSLRATTYALAHGQLYLPSSAPPDSIPTSAIHAPLTLFPSPIPRNNFQLAQKLQRIYNVLYSRIAMDDEFLDNVMGAADGV